MVTPVITLALADDVPLQPLRISEGWTVEYNTFYEVDADHPDAWTLLSESLLQLTHQRRNRLLDLGWYPEGEPDGSFRLCIYAGDFTGQLLFESNSQSRSDITAIIECMLDKVNRGEL
mgnify:FL=1